MTEGPKTPETPETIIEFVDTVNWTYVIAALMIGAAIGMVGLYAYSVMMEAKVQDAG